jgi:hypothetical protein
VSGDGERERITVSSADVRSLSWVSKDEAVQIICLRLGCPPGPAMAQLYELCLSKKVRAYDDPVHGWDMVWCVSREDLIFVLNQIAPTHAAKPDLIEPERRERARPDRENAEMVLKMLYPDGVPSQREVKNPKLIAAVERKLRDEKLPPVSPDTILRAAGRRK